MAALKPKPKYKITPARIRRWRIHIAKNKKWETAGGGITQVSDPQGRHIFVRDWLALHDRHLDVMHEVWLKFTSGDLDGAELQLSQYIGKWSEDG